MSESNSVIKLSESDAIEAGIIASSEFKYVVDEAIITCSNAEIENCPNNLMVDSQSKFYMHSRLVATKADNKPFINIKPFKCPCKYGECRPKFENTWENYVEDITAGGNEPLCEKSILKCTRYEEIGIISIIDTGQRLISDEINEISEMLKNIAQQGGTKQERLQKMTDYLRKKYGNNINVSDFKYENFGKGSILDLTLGEDPIHFINNSDRELFKYLDEYNKEGVFFKKKNRRINPDTGQPKVYEDEIVGNFYTNSAQYKYIKTMSPEIIKKITDGWQMEENEIKKAVSAQSSVIDKLIKAPDTVETVIDYNSLNTDVVYWSQPREFKKKEDAVQKKLGGFTKIPGIEGVDIVGYKKDKNGNTVLVVRDYRNILNEKDKQAIWNEYRKRGIKIENDPIGMFNSTVHATNIYNYLGGSYNDKYTDGALIVPLSTGIGFGKGYVVTRTLKKNGYLNKRVKFSSLEENDNPSLDIKGAREFLEKNKDTFLKSGRKNVDKLTIALSEAELSNGDKIYTMTINGKDSIKKTAPKTSYFNQQLFNIINEDSITSSRNLYLDKNNRIISNGYHSEKKNFGFISKNYGNKVKIINITIENVSAEFPGVCEGCYITIMDHWQDYPDTEINVFHGSLNQEKTNK